MVRLMELVTRLDGVDQPQQACTPNVRQPTTHLVRGGQVRSRMVEELP